MPGFAHLDRITACSVSTDGDTPLHIAAIRNEPLIAEELIRAGADLNYAGEHGYTPLHEAVEQGSQNVAHVLLAHGANESARNADGLTVTALRALLGEQER